MVYTNIYISKANNMETNKYIQVDQDIEEPDNRVMYYLQD